MSDDRSGRRGDGEKRASRSRSRERRRRSRSPVKEHSRRRHRSRSRSRSRSRDRDRERRRRSRERSRERRRYRSRSHERRRRHHGSSSSRDRSPGRWEHDRYLSGYGGAEPPARMRGYAAALSAGMDDELDGEPYASYEDGGPPSAVLRLTGLPEDAAESELRQLFEPIAGIREIRLPRDPATQRGRGSAFLEFDSVRAAVALMDSDWRDQTFFGQHRLRFEYARPMGPRLDAPGGAYLAPDWVCEFCKGINFGRRAACYQCQRERSEGARELHGPYDDEPSCILRVGNLQTGADEEALRFLFVPHAPVKDIRLVRDRYTGELRGTAYIEFYSVEDATKAMAACQHARLDTQEQRLILSYARDRFADDGRQQQQSRPPPEVAAEVALAYAGWQPKEFGESAAGGGGSGGSAEEDEDPVAAWERQQQQGAAGVAEGQAPQQQVGSSEAAAAAGYDPLSAAAELQPQPSGGAEQAQQADLAERRAAAEAAGFAFDPASGYMLEPTSGYYYDANTGLYCHPSVGQWGTYDFATGQFIPHDAAAAAAATAAAAAPGFSSAAESALALGSAQGYSSRLAAQAGLPAGQHASFAAQHQEQQQQLEGEPGSSKLQRPKRGAVIGASAQLDPQGLLEAARAAEERVQLLKKQQQLEEAKRRRQEAKQAARQARQQQMSAAAADAAAGVAGSSDAVVTASGAAPAAAPAAGAGVKGVIHESAWAAARRRQQLQP